MQVRLASTDDVDAVVTLVESAYRGDSSRTGWTTEAELLDGQRTDHAQVAELIAAGSVLVVDDPGAIVACCQLQPPGYFGMFAVAPSQQGTGTGSVLLAEAERRASAWGAVELEMTVIAQRTDLIAWYERRGYVRTGEVRPFPYGDERFGVPRRDDLAFVVLAKQLAVSRPDGPARSRTRR